MTAAEYQRWLKEDALRGQMRNLLIWLFVISLLGYPAPITGAIAGTLSYRFRRVLVGEVGTYLALGYGAALIGLIYSLVFLLLILGR